MTVDPDLHPGYLAEGLWRLFAYIRASQADEAAYLISLIATDVQSTIGALMCYANANLRRLSP